MALDRDQWLHLAKANAEVISSELERLRALLTDETRGSYAEFWAQARDVAEKFKTFKPLEVETREALWSEYRGICDATRALQDSERIHKTEASKAKRAEMEEALDKAAAAVESAETPQEFSRAAALVNQLLEQLRLKPAKERKRQGAAPPAGKPKAEKATPPADGETAAPEVALAVSETAEPAAPDAVPEVPPPSSESELAAPVASEEPAHVAPSAPEEEVPVAPAAAAPVEDKPPILLRSDREACWNRLSQIREALKVKRSGQRREVFEGVMARANEYLAAAETQDPRALQESIRAAQTELKNSGLSPNEQDAVRSVLRAAWKASSDRIESSRQERKKAHAEWVQRMTEHLARWETRALKNAVLITQIQVEIADAERQAASTHDEGRNDRFRQTIERKRARLAEFEASSKDMEEKIKSARDQMGKEAPEPIRTLPEEEIPVLHREREEAPRRRADRDRPPKRREAASDVSREPAPHPGLNLGDLLAQHFGLAAGAKAVEPKTAEPAPEEAKGDTEG